MSGSLNGNVELASIISAHLDARNYVTGARQIEQANERLAKTGEGVAVSSEKISRGAERAGRDFAKVAQELDPVIKLQANFTAQAEKIDNALRKGAISAEVHSAAMALLQQKFEQSKAAAAGAKQALDGIAQSHAAMARAAEEAAQKFAASQSQMAAAAQQAQRAQQSELERLERRFHPLISVNEAYRKELADVASAEKRGILNAKEAAAERERLANAYDKQRAAMKAAGQQLVPTQAADAGEKALKKVADASKDVTNAFGVTARQAQQLAPQINDVVTSLLGGASAFQVLTQQGGQITQAMGGVGNTFRALAGLFTPMRVGVLAVGGALVASFAAYEGTERRVATLRGQLRGYAADYEDMARVLDKQARRVSETLPGVSSSDVRTAQSRLIGIVTADDRQNIGEYIRDITDLAKSIDTDLNGAISRFAKVYRSPAEAARELADAGIRGFNEEFRRSIELMERGGDRAGAFQAVLTRLRENFRGAGQDGSPFQQSLSALNKEFESLWNTIKDGLAGPATGFTRWLAETLRANRENGQSQTLPNGDSLFRTLFGIGPAGRQGAPAGAPPNADRARQAYDYFVSQGQTPAVAAGLAAQIQAESGFNASATHDGNTGYGLIGFRGDRLTNLGRFIGGDPRTATFEQQLAFMQHELTAGSERRAGAMLANEADPSLAGYNLSRYYVRPRDVEGNATFRAGLAAQYSRTFTAGAAPAAANSNAPFFSEYGAGPFSTGAGMSRAQQEYEQRQREMRGQGGPSVDAENLNARLRQQIADQQQTEKNSQAWLEWQDAIDKTRAAIAALESPMEKLRRQQREELSILSQPEGFQRDLRRRLFQLDETTRGQRGTEATPEEQASVRNSMLAERSVAFRDSQADLQRQIEAESKLAEAQRGGVTAMQEQAAANQARERVRQLGLTGTEQEAAATQALTEDYKRLNAAKQNSAVAGLLNGQQQQIALMRDQLGTIGLSPADAARKEAEIQARNMLEFRQGAGSAETPAGQEYIRNAMQMADLRTQGRYLQEIAGYGREAASILTDGFRAFAFQGAKAKDVLKNMEQALLDLGTRALVLKPLEQALSGLAVNLFGGGKGGAGGLSGALGSLFGSGGSAAAEIAAGTAMEGFKSTGAAILEGGLKLAAVAHTGGVIGNDNLPARVVPGSLFRGAPRFHGGGGYLARDEFPAILQMGERVLTQRQQAATVAAVRGGRNVTVIQNIRTDDPGAFKRSSAQVARDGARGIQRASRSA